MAAQPSLPLILVGLGIGLLLIAAIPVGGSTDADYAHSVEPAMNGTLEHGIEYDDSDVVPYENLSKQGQTVFDRARRDSPYIVENWSDAASDFDYTGDNVDVGHGLYAIQYAGDIYSLETERKVPGFNPLRWLLSLLLNAFQVLGIILTVAGGLLAGWRRYRS